MFGPTVPTLSTDRITNAVENAKQRSEVHKVVFFTDTLNSGGDKM